MLLSIKKLSLACTLFALVGCAGRQVVPMQDLANPPRSESYYVMTRQGGELEFVTLRAERDTLQGTVRTVNQRVVGQGNNERVEERNQYRDVSIPFSDVERVEIRKSGPSSLLLAVAGAAVVGGIYLIVNKPDNTQAGDGGGGGGKTLGARMLRGTVSRSPGSTQGP